MIRLSMMMGRTAAWAAVLVFGLGAATHAGTVDVYSNSPGGDTVSMDGPTGTAGWGYFDLSGNGKAGINNNILDSNGGGSLWLSGSAPANNYSGGAIYYTGDSLGSLSNLTTLSYDWFRSSSSTVDGWLAPSLALYVSDGQTSGYLIYEPAYNEYPTSGPGVPVDAWTSSNITANSMLWSPGTSLPRPLPTQFTHSLSAWQGALSDYSIYGVTPFFGAGWTGEFTGAVDFVHIGFGTDPGTTYDFQVVPEPASVVSMLIAGGIGLAGAAYRRRRAC